MFQLVNVRMDKKWF